MILFKRCTIDLFWIEKFPIDRKTPCLQVTSSLHFHWENIIAALNDKIDLCRLFQAKMASVKSLFILLYL